MLLAKSKIYLQCFPGTYEVYMLLCDYRGNNNKNPPLRIFGLRIFTQVLIILLFSDQNFLLLLLFSKKIRLRRAFIILFFSEAKFGHPGGRFSGKIRVFALKTPLKIFACGGLADRAFIILKKKIPPAAGF